MTIPLDDDDGPATRPDLREFLGRRAETEESIAALSSESQAALRQFSFERVLAYGVDYADVVELRARVLEGQPWRTAATEVAEICLQRAGAPADPTSALTRAAYLRRASALLRMSQVMMLEDTDERRQIYARAVDLYAEAARITGDRTPFTVTSDEGMLAGWHLPGGQGVADEAAVGSVIVVGGVEGYAMDFDSMGEALAARDVDVYLLDTPGQGETRMAHHVYLTRNWLSTLRSVVDEVDSRASGRPIAVIGNSMGGSLAMALAAADTRISACCDNGGIATPGLISPAVGTFFTKMKTFCNSESDEETAAIWSSVDPTADGPNAGYPLLIVHGGQDPLVSDPLVQLVLDGVPTKNSELVVFSDGYHCIYNHREDRDLLIADWIHDRLARPVRAED